LSPPSPPSAPQAPKNPSGHIQAAFCPPWAHFELPASWGLGPLGLGLGAHCGLWPFWLLLTPLGPLGSCRGNVRLLKSSHWGFLIPPRLWFVHFLWRLVFLGLGPLGRKCTISGQFWPVFAPLGPAGSHGGYLG
jgi:hypothetical protein